jgi:hypothetical protein
MCGYFAARSVLRRAFGFKRLPASLMAQTVAQRS